MWQEFKFHSEKNSATTFRQGVNMDFTKYFVTLFIVGSIMGGAVAGLAIWLAPIAWAWLKPILHQVTA